MQHLIYLIKREFDYFWSNKVFVFAFLCLPLLLALVLGFVYKKGRINDQPIILVDLDGSPWSGRLSDMLEDSPVLKVVVVKHEMVDLHQHLLDYRAVAVVVIPHRFEANLLHQLRPEVNCYLNMANTLTSGAVGGAVSQCIATLNGGILKQETIRHNVFYQYNSSGNYLYFLWPGLIFSVLQQLLLLALAVSFSREVEQQYFNLEGLLKYSQSAFMLILVKIIPYVLLSFITMGVYFLLSGYFRIPLPRYPGLFLLSQLLMVLGTCFLGVFYSIIYPMSLKASQLLMSIASPAFTISGFTWPADQMPAFLEMFAQIIPLTPFLKALRMILFQEASWQDIAPQFMHQLILILVFWGAGIVLLHVKINKGRATHRLISRA